jgi:four helix bundle protein
MAFRFEGLEIYELAIVLARMVYEISARFPREEMFGLTANLRRAATSVALNIAEGSGRGTKREFARFIDVAAGSLFETVAALRLAEQLGFVKPDTLSDVRARAETLSRKLSSFKRSLTISHMP